MDNTKKHHAAPRLFDRGQVIQAVTLLAEPGGVVELRLLNAAAKSDRWASTHAGYFDNPQKLVEALRNVKEATGCYLTLNCIDNALLGRACNRLVKVAKGGTTSDSNVTRRRWLLIDIDARRPAGISATATEREAALKRTHAVDLFLHNLGWPLPVFADSGNGFHLLYRVDLPADDGGLVKRVLEALAARFDDEKVKVDRSVHNPARISKLYGTLVCKGDNTPDRPHRMAKILECPETMSVVEIPLLEDLAGEAAPAVTQHGATSTGQPFNAEAFILRHGLEVGEPGTNGSGTTWEFQKSPMCEHHRDGPWITQFSNGALSAGCHHNSCNWTWHDLRAKYEPRSKLLFGGREARGQTPPPRPNLPGVEKFTLAELISKYPTLQPPVVDGLFRQGETCNLISASKIGKSWLGYSLLLSVAAGRPWLGQFNTASGKVLLIDNELHPSTLAKRIPKVAEAMELFESEYQDDLDIWPLRGQLRSLAELGAEFKQIPQGQYKLILFDAKYRFATSGSSENDNAAETQTYNLLDQYADQLEAALVLIHHSSKGSQTDKRVTDVGSGAGAQSRAADCHLVLREHDEADVVVLDAAVRSFKPVEPLALRWQFPLWLPAADVDAGKLRGNLSKKEQQQAGRDKEGMDQIVTALLSGPATKGELRRQTGISKDRLDRLMDRLCFEKQVTCQDLTVRGNPCQQFQLAKTEK